MGISTPNGTSRLRQSDELVAAVSMTASQLAQAVGRFDGDKAAMVLAAVRTAQRAFSELDACDDVIDRASDTGLDIAGRLRELLAAESVADIPAQLDALEATSAGVRGTAATRALLNRLLALEQEVGPTPPTVGRLSSSELPSLPSAYADDDGFADLMAVAARGEELAPQLRNAHADRLARVADHLVEVVRQAAVTGFAEEAFAEESVREARRAYELWLQCLAERKRDLG
ncbi:hypothetical protein EF912_12230 [Streptomyces sp. WAC07061]|uniref:hypothetical protein n=1 Tax=Streptomyces sp. WAC07061 TaxID=2487410 RepID=UPI000F793BEE|nr:hypothetical protein [Streptomyces sp. WAC07061]RSS58001.1 hypothetical protein EF912_12230 [Streptomyces sp. WAC07061]